MNQGIERVQNFRPENRSLYNISNLFLRCNYYNKLYIFHIMSSSL